MESTPSSLSPDQTNGAQDSIAKSQTQTEPSNSFVTSPPPYWTHTRSLSCLSQTSLDNPPPITLQDHTEIDSPSSSGLWAKAVSIDDYVVIRGNPTAIGAYVVWNCKVQTLDGGPMVIRKRYSEFDDLRHKLSISFPNAEASLPTFPPKSAICKSEECSSR